MQTDETIRETTPTGAMVPGPKEQDGVYDIDILDLILVPLKYKWKIFRIALIVGILTAISVWTSPNIYTAVTRILPPQADQSLSSQLLNQLGPLAGLTGGSLPVRNPIDLYVSMLESRTVGEAMDKRFGLQKLYVRKTTFDTLVRLKANTAISTGKDGVITIEVDDLDPQRAADMANAYVDELRKLTQGLAITEASQRRLFFEKQLRESRDQLSEAEIVMKQTQEATGLLEPEGQSKAIIGSIANLRGQIAAKEVQLGTSRSFATEANPDVQRLRQEIAELQAQLQKLGQSSAGKGDDLTVSAKKLPEASLRYLRAYRDLKYNEAIVEVLTKQYELARIDEAKYGPVVQVIDTAVKPEKKSKPRRTTTTLLMMLLAGFLATLWAFLRESAHGMIGNPRNQDRVRALKQYFYERPGPSFWRFR